MNKKPKYKDCNLRLTEEQMEWIESHVVPGRVNRSQAVRQIIDELMEAECQATKKP